MAIEVHFEKRVVNNMNVVRELDVRHQREYLILTLLGGFFVLVLLFYGWQHYMWIQYGYRIEAAEKKKEQIAEVVRQLRTERASLRSMKRIDSIARTQLGMIPATGDQLLFLSADSPPTIPVPQRRMSDEEAQMAAKR
jgi:cell division protein FtsL